MLYFLLVDNTGQDFFSPPAQQQEPVLTQYSQQDSKQKPKLILAGIAIIALMAVIIGIMVLVTKKDSPVTQKSTPSSFSQIQMGLKDTKQWVNCDDLRDVIEEGNKLYVACLGGVLVVDKNSGNVLDQISMTNGLGNSIATSLVKKGEKLYIGTQDGFTVFDINTRQAKKISVAEGLVNGSNITLEEDGDDLWVGTFRGVSKYNVVTGKIKNYTTELLDNSYDFSSNHVLATPNAVYVLITSNVQGGVVRWDKKENKWERFSPAAFLNPLPQYPRVDFMRIERIGRKVYVFDYDGVWEVEDKVGSSWKKLDVLAKIAGGSKNTATMVGSSGQNLLFVMENSLYSYNVEKAEINRIYPVHNEENSILSGSYNPTDIMKDGKLWIELNRESGRFLGWIDTENLKTGAIKLAERPEVFEKIAALIDGNPFLVADGKLTKYDLSTNEFKKIETFDSLLFESGYALEFTFKPIANSQKIFISSQYCGRGCLKPSLAVYNYQDDFMSFVEIPSQIMQKISQQSGERESYSDLRLLSFDSSSGEARFMIQDEGDMLTYNINNNSWNTIAGSGTDTFSAVTHFCNPSYTFEKNSQKFSETKCTEQAENENYKWEVEDSQVVWQTDKKTGQKTQVSLNLAPEEYSPFGQKNTIGIYAITYSDEYLWIATNRGINKYDPTEGKTMLISTKDGLVDNNVGSFVVDGDAIWAITRGLSGIPLIK